MVLDPLTALSVAGNIVQFTDFGVKLLKEGRELYASADGSIQHNRELELMSDDLRHLVDRIRKSIVFTVPENGPTDQERSSIFAVAKECDKLADILLGILASLKIQPQDKQSKWRTFQQALRSVRSESEIDNIAQRLANARAQLDTNILVHVK